MIFNTPDTNSLDGQTKCRIFHFPPFPSSGTDRQIQPLGCVSKSSGEKGVCMFAWNCVEAGGSHLGTCIDRFYFGSCCKMPEDGGSGGGVGQNGGVSRPQVTKPIRQSVPPRGICRAR